jgi:small-conductance mechanosensitive channel/CRP-like cAMP-binding protein
MPDLPLSAVIARVLGHLTFLLVGGVLVVVAYLINHLAPEKRPRIRRTVILFGLYVVTELCAATLHVTGADAAWRVFSTAAAMLQAFTIINIAALALFDLALARIGIGVALFATDMIVGVAYVGSAVLCLVDAGLNPSSILGASAVVSAVLAISLQGTLGNILGGVAFQLDGSVHVGDWVELENGKQGRVREIRWRHTAIETRNWDTIIVPNATLLGQSFSILGRRAGMPIQHRMWVYFHVDFRFSPNTVIQAVNDALQGSPMERVAADPKPHAILMDLAKDGRDSFGYYAARYWLTDLAVDDPTSSIVRSRIYAGLRRAGIPLARPSTTAFLGTNEQHDDGARLARHVQKRIAAVESVEFFAGLTGDEREFVAQHLRYAPFAAGETITRQGAVAHWLYIITTGRVEVRRHAEGKTALVAEVVAPGFVGEMGLLTGATRTADVVACTDVECYRLDKQGFQRVVTERPEAAKQFSEALARRQIGLTAADEKLDEATKSVRQAEAQAAILQRIEDFFGLKQ